MRGIEYLSPTYPIWVSSWFKFRALIQSFSFSGLHRCIKLSWTFKFQFCFLKEYIFKFLWHADISLFNAYFCEVLVIFKYRQSYQFLSRKIFHQVPGFHRNVGYKPSVSKSRFLSTILESIEKQMQCLILFKSWSTDLCVNLKVFSPCTLTNQTIAREWERKSRITP